MKIEILYLPGCPNYPPALDRLKRVLRQNGAVAEISEIEVKDADAARAVGFFGSPTIRIDGLDIDPESRNITETGLACRRYVDGLPSEAMIDRALKHAMKQ